MFGGSGKMGRGGGGGKRSIHAPPINRTGRPSMDGGPRGRGGAPPAAVSSSPSMQVEESFSLVRENPLSFGMAVKLAPDLVEEIKRLEAQGLVARMKFDVNANNPNGNVIHVGDKIFRFTWSREPGDLCDVYEERQCGEDGNGLLVESGGTWRKLNVERELDESTKNHVKMRSEEAERKHKSRKAIVLDHQNPSMKSQVKAIAAAESNPWRNFKNRKEPPYKKAKVEPPSGGPSKSAVKTGLSTTLSKGKIPSGSPLTFQRDQVSPVGSRNLVKGHADVTDVAPTQSMNNIGSSGKEIHGRLPNSIFRDKSKQNRNTEAKPADLKSLVISLLQEHQQNGMSLKALEKAAGDVMPNSARQLDPILKQVAIFKAPGRYYLKGVVEKESFKKPPSQSGSSPEISRHRSPSPQKSSQLPVQDSSFPIATPADGEEEQGELNSTPLHTADITEKIDIMQNSPQQLNEKKVSDNTEGLAGSSSDSGSDSDSDSSSSDSDSESHSRSKSRSPVGSSSDSESDASISSKQASDEDVDIMSDDDKESNQKLLDPVQWSNPEDESVIGTYEKQDDLHLTDVIEIEKDSPEDERPSANYLFPNNEGREHVEEMRPSSVDHLGPQERETSHRRAYNEPEGMVNESVSNGKSKRHHDDRHSDEWTQNRKKFKSKNLSQPVYGTINSLFGDSPDDSSPDRPLQDLEKGSAIEVVDRATRDGNNDPGSQIDFKQRSFEARVDRATRDGTNDSDSQIGVNRRSFEARVSTEAPSGEKRPGKHDSSDRGAKYSDKNLQTNESLRIQRGFNSEAHSEDGLVGEKRPVKFSSEGVADEHTTTTESHHRKPENSGKVKEAGPHSNLHMSYSPKENNAAATTTTTADRLPLTNGRGNVLRREYSDLELGEFRDPVQDVTPLPKKQLERKRSSKHLENKSMNPECKNSDSSRGKPPSNKITAHPGIKSSPKKASENHVNDLTKSHHKSTRPMDQHHQSLGEHIGAGPQHNNVTKTISKSSFANTGPVRAPSSEAFGDTSRRMPVSSTEHIGAGPQHNNVTETISKSRFADAGPARARSSEAFGDTSRRMPVNSTEQQHDPVRGVEPHTTKGTKKQKKPNVLRDSNGRRIDASLTASNDGGQRKREFSSEENSLYAKYEKEEPELKGPIKDASQYKEYVKEYQEKYESYCSLNKILESYRDEFSKFGKDLEAYKGRDMKRYQDTLKKMRSSFRECGERHKRQKKIFLVLYEELKHLKHMIKDYAASI